MKVNENDFSNLMQYVEVKSEERRVTDIFEKDKSCLLLDFANACFVDDNLYFSALDFNCIFKGNINTGEVTLIDFCHEESVNSVLNHFCIEKIGDRIYFIPDGKKIISVLDLKSDKVIESIEIPFVSHVYRINYSYTKGYDVYMFGMDLNIYKLDTRKNQVEHCKNLSIERTFGEGKWYNNQVAQKENLLFVPIYKTNSICVIDWNYNHSTVVSLKENVEIYGCCCIDNYIWITAMNTILKCDINLNVVKRYGCDKNLNEIDFQNIRDFDDKIVFIDNTNKGFLKYDKNINKWSYELHSRRKYNFLNKWSGCIYVIPNSNYYIDMDNKEFGELCKNNKICFSIKKDIVINEAKNRKIKIVNEKDCLTENSFFSLNEFIDILG